MILRCLLPCLLFASGAIAATCLENKDFHRDLPTSIGREDQLGKFPFALNCDTVFVRKGVTTLVNPGVLLYFSRPSINSVIKVEGTLILRGTRNSYVTLSGSADSGQSGLEPGGKFWGGIEVADGGRLEMEYVGFMQAPTPITTFSPKVKIVNCWFKGSSGMSLPDGNLYPMESSWHAINDLDLTKGSTDRKAAARPTEALSDSERAAAREPGKGFWTWKRAGIGVGALALVGAGAFFLLPDDESEPPAGPPVSRETGIPSLSPPPDM